MDLLFGNWIGIISMITVRGALATVLFSLMLYRKSHDDKQVNLITQVPMLFMGTWVNVIRKKVHRQSIELLLFP